jgi:hypothetical protein
VGGAEYCQLAWGLALTGPKDCHPRGVGLASLVRATNAQTRHSLVRLRCEALLRGGAAKKTPRFRATITNQPSTPTACSIIPTALDYSGSVKGRYGRLVKWTPNNLKLDGLIGFPAVPSGPGRQGTSR